MKSHRWYFAILAGAVLVLAYVAPAGAVPMWTRRYGVSCSTCHSYPGLQLTSTGLDFLRRGHRMEGDKFDKDFAHLISGHAEWNYTVQQGQSTPLPEPDFHFHVGGAISEQFSTYIDANINKDFEVVYLQYTKSQGADSYFTARAGKIIPTIIRDYGAGITASASTPLIVTDATLGDNPFNPARDSFGFNVAQRWKSLFFEGGVVNGPDFPGQAAVQNHKDVYASVEYNAEGQPTGAGIYYYRGGYDIVTDPNGPFFDRYDRIAGFVNYTTDTFRLTGAYLTGKDRRPSLPDQKINGYFVQADGHPGTWVVPFVRYDDVKTETDSGTGRVKQWTAGSAVKLLENDVTGACFAVELSRRQEAGVNTKSALIHLLWAF